MSTHARSKPAHRKSSTAAREAARETTNALRANIEASMEALAAEMQGGIGEHLKAVLAFGARFHKYSPMNQLAILDQCPHATRVAGYRAWEKLGYHVAKGQRGIRIFAPRPYQRTEVGDDGEDVTTSRVSFTTVAVFDASQLNAEELAEKPLPTFFADLGGDEASDALAERLMAAMRAAGITVEEKLLPGGIQGYSVGGKVAVREGQGTRNRANTLAHEWAHELLHQGEENAEQKARGNTVRECHAEATAYAVLTYFGVPSELSSDYLRSWGNTAETLMAELAMVQKAASAIIAALEPKETEAEAQAETGEEADAA
jgi:hypothetical protein